MKKTLLFVSAFLFFVGQMFANPVDVNTAKNLGAKYLRNNVLSAKDVADVELFDRVTDDVRGLVVLKDLEADWRDYEIDLGWVHFEFEVLILDVEVWGNGLTESDWVRNLAIFDEAGKREFLVVKNVRDSAFTIANGEFDA